MDGFILAAGRGTRLRPLTDRVPKALVEVGGRPLLAHVATRLVAAGVDRLVVNLHHLGEQIEAYLATHEFGVPVLLSWEGERPLETGGALRHAAGLLRRDAPFLLHNVDVLTDLPLRELWEAQRREDALATVAVMERPTRRRLLFDDEGLVGWQRDAEVRWARPPRGAVVALAYAGVQAIDPALLDRLEEEGAFPLWVPYLRLAAAGARIAPFRVDGCCWLDVGRPETLVRAQAEAHAWIEEAW